MKKITCSIVLLLSVSTISKADVIYSPYTDFGMAASLECIGSYELPFTKYNSIDFWGGIGIVSMFDTFKNPAYGTEMAIELRHYFKDDLFEKFNVGLYTGFAYMRHPYFYGGHLVKSNNSVGFVPGLKLTYKKNINSWLVAEPYIGISTPWYDNDLGDLFNWIFHSDPGLILTFGVRIGFNKIRSKD